MKLEEEGRIYKKEGRIKPYVDEETGEELDQSPNYYLTKLLYNLIIYI